MVNVQPFNKISLFSEVVTRILPNDFVHRHWLVDEITAFVEDSRRRHFIITGGPGTGKTSLIAYMAQQWNCPRYFVRVDNRWGNSGVSARHFLISIAHQLYQKYGRQVFPMSFSGDTTVNTTLTGGRAQIIGRLLDKLYTLPFLESERRDVRVKAGVVLGESQVIGERIEQVVNIAEGLDTPTLLHVCLIAPLTKLQQLHPNERVILLIDALDEGLAHPQNELIADVIPQPNDAEFPQNLWIVMTSRLGGHLVGFREEDQINLDSKDKFSYITEDIHNYIKAKLKSSPFVEIIANEPKSNLKTYWQQIATASGNNFLYLFHYFEEAKQQIQLGLKDLRQIPVPKGLDEIYRVFALKKIKEQARRHGGATLHDWVKLYLPILGVLAVAQAPLERSKLIGIAAVDDNYVDEVLSILQPFLNIVRENRENSFQIFHTSFSEYLLDSSRNRDFPLDASKYHRRIVNFYRGQHTSLIEVDWKFVSDRYPFLHLTTHLYNADQKDSLYALLTTSPDWLTSSFYILSNNAKYIQDVNLLLQHIHAPLESTEILRYTSLWSVKQVVRHRAGEYSVNALETLAWLEGSDIAINHARLIADHARRFYSLLRLSVVQAKSGLPYSELLSEAVKSALYIESEENRFEAFESCLVVLKEISSPITEQVFEVLSELLGYLSRDNNVRGLISFCTVLACIKNFNEASQIAQQIIDLPPERLRIRHGVMSTYLEIRPLILVELIELLARNSEIQIISGLLEAVIELTADIGWSTEQILALLRLVDAINEVTPDSVIIDEILTKVEAISAGLNWDRVLDVLISWGLTLYRIGRREEADRKLSQAETLLESGIRGHRPVEFTPLNESKGFNLEVWSAYIQNPPSVPVVQEMSTITPQDSPLSPSERLVPLVLLALASAEAQREISSAYWIDYLKQSLGQLSDNAAYSYSSQRFISGLLEGKYIDLALFIVLEMPYGNAFDLWKFRETCRILEYTIERNLNLTEASLSRIGTLKIDDYSMQRKHGLKQATEKLLRLLVQCDRMDLALSFVIDVSVSEIKADLLYCIASAVASGSDKPKAKEFFDQASEILHASQLQNQRFGEAISSIAQFASLERQFDFAFALASEIKESDQKARTLVTIAENALEYNENTIVHVSLTEAGRLLEDKGYRSDRIRYIKALMRLRGVSDNDAIEDLLPVSMDLACALLEMGNLLGAKQIVQSLQNTQPYPRSPELLDIYVSLIAKLCQTGNFEEADTVFDSAYISVGGGYYSRDHINLLTEYAESLAQSVHREKATELFAYAERLARFLAKHTWTDIGGRLHEDIVEKTLAEGLGIIICSAFRSRHFDIADRLFDELIELALLRGDERNDFAGYYKCNDIYSPVIEALVDAGDFARAKRVVRQMRGSKDDRTQGRIWVANALIEQCEFSDALEWILSFEHWESKEQQYLFFKLGIAMARNAKDISNVVSYVTEPSALKQIRDTKAIALAQQAKLTEAITLTELLDLDTYMDVLAHYGCALNAADRPAFFKSLQNAARVMGWVRSDWQKIYVLSQGQ